MLDWPVGVRAAVGLLAGILRPLLLLLLLIVVVVMVVVIWSLGSSSSLSLGGEVVTLWWGTDDFLFFNHLDLDAQLEIDHVAFTVVRVIFCAVLLLCFLIGFFGFF